MTDANANGIQAKEVILYDSEGEPIANVTGTVDGVNGLRVYIGPTDPISDTPVVMLFNQHQIHKGEAYYAQYVDTGLETNTVKFGLTVPVFAVGVNAPHLVLKVDVYNGTARVDMYEGATFTGGSDLPSYNRNRNSSTTPGMTLKSGVTSTNGTLIQSVISAGGIRSGDSGDTGEEWILKSNTIYRLDLIGLVAGTDAILRIEWYEDLGV